MNKPKPFVDPTTQEKLQSAYGEAINFRNADGTYAAKNLTEIKALQQQLDAGGRRRRNGALGSYHDTHHHGRTTTRRLQPLDHTALTPLQRYERYNSTL